MGNDLPPKTKTDRRDPGSNGVFGKRDFCTKPRIPIGMPVFFVSGLAATVDHGDSNRLVNFR